MKTRAFLFAAFLMFAAKSTWAQCPGNTHVTIVFGNGILTDYAHANQSLKILKSAILAALGPSFPQSCISFFLAYDSQFSDSNNSLVSMENVFLQLADAAAQEGIDFAANFWSCWNLTLQSSASCRDIQRQYILSATSIYQPDLLDQEAFYKSELAAGHRVIVVAHSQGNLYANQTYELVTASGGSDLFHIVAVATPAPYVAGSGPHFTLQGDIITLVPSHLAYNITNDPPSPCPAYPLVNLACHSFDSSYMDLQKGDHTRPAIVNAVSAFFQVRPARFAYVADSCSPGGIWAFTIDAQTGTLAQVVGSPFPGNLTPDAVAVSPSGKFLYAANGGGPGYVSGYLIDALTGALNPLPDSPFVAAFQPSSVAIDPSGRFAYVTIAQETILAYVINGDTGSLTAVGTSSVPTGSFPRSAVVDPTGHFVYVANVGSNNISAYTISAVTGALAPISGSPFSAGLQPISIAAEPTGRFVYVANANTPNQGTVSGYAINPATGALTPISGSPFAAGIVPSGVAVHPSGRFLYVTNRLSIPATISIYSIDAVTGYLAPLSGSPFPTDPNPFSITIDPSGQFAYTANAGSPLAVSGFKIDASTGVLAPVPGSAFAAGTCDTSITTTYGPPNQ